MKIAWKNGDDIIRLLPYQSPPLDELPFFGPPWHRLRGHPDLFRCATCPITGARNWSDARRLLFKRWCIAKKCPDLREIHTRKEVVR